MEEFLKKLGLIAYLETTLKIQKDDFANTFYQHVDPGDASILTAFNPPAINKNEYRGFVSTVDFKVKRKPRFFDANGCLAVAIGDFHQNGETLTISAKIKGPNYVLLLLSVFFGLIYIMIATSFIIRSDEIPYLLFLFITSYAILILAIVAFFINRNVKRLKYELERDFFFWTETHPNHSINY